MAAAVVWRRFLPGCYDALGHCWRGSIAKYGVVVVVGWLDVESGGGEASIVYVKYKGMNVVPSAKAAAAMAQRIYVSHLLLLFFTNPKTAIFFLVFRRHRCRLKRK